MQQLNNLWVKDGDKSFRFLKDIDIFGLHTFSHITVITSLLHMSTEPKIILKSYLNIDTLLVLR